MLRKAPKISYKVHHYRLITNHYFSRTLLQNLRSFLRQKYPAASAAIIAVQVIYLMVFFWCRVYLPYFIIERYAEFSERSALQTFTGVLHLPCQIGTASIAIINGIWWLKMVNLSIIRYSIMRNVTRHV